MEFQKPGKSPAPPRTNQYTISSNELIVCKPVGKDCNFSQNSILNSTRRVQDESPLGRLANPSHSSIVTRRDVRLSKMGIASKLWHWMSSELQERGGFGAINASNLSSSQPSVTNSLRQGVFNITPRIITVISPYIRICYNFYPLFLGIYSD